MARPKKVIKLDQYPRFELQVATAIVGESDIIELHYMIEKLDENGIEGIHNVKILVQKGVPLYLPGLKYDRTLINIPVFKESTNAVV